MVAPHCKSSKYLSILVEIIILSPTISIGHLAEGGDPIVKKMKGQLSLSDSVIENKISILALISILDLSISLYLPFKVGWL